MHCSIFELVYLVLPKPGASASTSWHVRGRRTTRMAFVVMMMVVRRATRIFTRAITALGVGPFWRRRPLVTRHRTGGRVVVFGCSSGRRTVARQRMACRRECGLLLRRMRRWFATRRTRCRRRSGCSLGSAVFRGCAHHAVWLGARVLFVIFVFVAVQCGSFRWTCVRHDDSRRGAAIRSCCWHDISTGGTGRWRGAHG